MADEQARLEMYEAFREVVGLGPATTLMENLPPSDGGGLATKFDVELVRRDMRELELRLHAELHRELAATQRNLFFAIAGLQAAFAALILGLG